MNNCWLIGDVGERELWTKVWTDQGRAVKATSGGVRGKPGERSRISRGERRVAGDVEVAGVFLGFGIWLCSCSGERAGEASGEMTRMPIEHVGRRGLPQLGLVDHWAQGLAERT